MRSTEAFKKTNASGVKLTQYDSPKSAKNLCLRTLFRATFDIGLKNVVF